MFAFGKLLTRTVHQTILRQSPGGTGFIDPFLALEQACQNPPAVLTQIRLISKKRYKFPELNESDLEESFVRGSGPGGQKVNKTSNCVLLKHTPTGIFVKCQAGRSLVENRRIARDRLRYHLDIELNGDNSFDAQSKKELAVKRKTQNLKAKKLLEKKKAFKEREGLN